MSKDWGIQGVNDWLSQNCFRQNVTTKFQKLKASWKWKMLKLYLTITKRFLACWLVESYVRWEFLEWNDSSAACGSTTILNILTSFLWSIKVQIMENCCRFVNLFLKRRWLEWQINTRCFVWAHDKQMLWLLRRIIFSFFFLIFQRWGIILSLGWKRRSKTTFNSTENSIQANAFPTRVMCPFWEEVWKVGRS